MFKGAMAGLIWVLGLALAPGRIFTDSQGREVDAEVLMVQVKEGTVTLSVNGSASKFPITDLSVDDQAYLKEWLARPFQPKVKVEVRQDQGMSPAEFRLEEERKPKHYAIQERLPDDLVAILDDKRIPVEGGTDRVHYVIETTNRTLQELTHLSIKAALYIRDADGSIEPHLRTVPLSRPLKGTASARFTLASVVADRSAGQSFGGYWVEIYQGAKKVGEAKSLAPNVNPAKILPP